MTTRVNNRMLDTRSVSVIDFGADPTGVVDSSAAFKAASAYAADAIREIKEIIIPAGEYLLTEKDSMTVNVTSAVNGFAWRGAGMGATIINYINEEPVADNYLIRNENRELRVNYYGIRFQGNAASENSKFYYMNSSGTGQSIRFWDCMWYQFYSIMEIEGSANASEMLYTGCKTSNIYGPAYVVDNVQSLNHNFHGCDFEVHFADIFKFTKGGILNFFGGSLILFDHPTSGTSGSVINVSGAASEIGSNNWNYNFHGVRTELHGTSTLVSQQAAGKITFRDSNTEVITGDATRNIASINESGWVMFDGGHVNGKFNLVGNSASAWSTPWRQAELLVENATLGQDFQVTRVALDNSGGNGRWRIRGCKKQQDTANPTQIWDEDNGFQYGYSGITCSSKFAVVGRQDGNLPATGTEVSITIPLNAKIISARLVHTGQAGPTGLTYRLHNDNDSVTFATWNFDATDTVSEKQDFWHDAGSLNRTLKLVSNAPSTYNGYVIVEYI